MITHYVWLSGHPSYSDVVISAAQLNELSITNITVRQDNWVAVHDAVNHADACVRAREYVDALEMLKK